jgi:hypothetical protein
MTVILGMGLKEIGRMAFQECTLLREIVILPSVRGIKERAFNGCSWGWLGRRLLLVADCYVKS